VSAYFEKQTFSIDLALPFEIRFYVFPIKDVPYLRQKLVELKKEIS